MKKRKGISGAAIAGIMLLWLLSLLLVGLGTAAVVADVTLTEGDVMDFWTFLKTHMEDVRRYTEDKIMPMLLSVLTVASTVVALLWPTVVKVRRSAGLFHVASSASVRTMEEGERIRAENEAFRAESDRQMQAFMAEEEKRMQALLETFRETEDRRMAAAEKQAAERAAVARETEARTRQISEMLCVGFGGLNELVKKNVASQVQTIGGVGHEEIVGEGTDGPVDPPAEARM